MSETVNEFSNVTLKEIAEKIKEYDEFRIVYHIRPDGDCIGSAYALALALKAAGKKCDVVGRDPVPHIHEIMTSQVKMDELKNPVYFLVDTATAKRAGDYGKEHITFCVDHHRDDDVEADYKYVEADCGACCEIILKLIKAMGVEVTKLMADLLYTGLVTDTNCFRTTDTNVQTFETAAELYKYGAEIQEIARRNTLIKSSQRMKLEDILRSSFDFRCDGRLCVGIITLKDLETAGIEDSELEGINSLAELIEGVRIGVTIREYPGGILRCSLRTNSGIAANEICNKFGGGGHFNAASSEMTCSIEEAKRILIEECTKILE